MTERIIPVSSGRWTSLTTFLIYLRHVAAYEFAQSYILGKSVLDLGCGAGYGTKTLASLGAGQITGIDLSSTNLPEIDRVGKPFINGNILKLPFPDRTFDTIVSFQVIEHIDNELRYLAEVYRVLSPGGIFILSTPNKALRLLPFQPPFNPYHVREYTLNSFGKALKQQFSEVELLGLQATSEVMQIEYARLKKDPIQVYSQLLFGRPTSIPRRVSKIKRILFGKKVIKTPVSETYEKREVPDFEQIYSTRDYWVSPDNIPSALDLIGICRKS